MAGLGGPMAEADFMEKPFPNPLFLPEKYDMLNVTT